MPIRAQMHPTLYPSWQHKFTTIWFGAADFIYQPRRKASQTVPETKVLVGVITNWYSNMTARHATMPQSSSRNRIA
jgi:hypothetical protein